MKLIKNVPFLKFRVRKIDLSRVFERWFLGDWFLGDCPHEESP